MFIFILFFILALLFGYFATQNTETITITLANSVISGVPLYVVIGITFILGLAFSWLLSLLDWFSSSLALRGKDSAIQQSKKTVQDLATRINQLEIENAELRGKVKQEEAHNESLTKHV